jgi:SAM-dependent methyltransferase
LQRQIARRTFGRVNDARSNLDAATVEGFGEEWRAFRYEEPEKLRSAFEAYFSLFPWTELPIDAVGFDLGCGSGRWAAMVAPRVGHLHCVDASAAALSVARQNLRAQSNCSFHHASVGQLPFDDASMDFAYSLGVLHHVPDTLAGIRACVAKLKPGAPLLLYLYYALENRGAGFRTLWRASDLARRGISRLPFRARLGVSQALAAAVYYPLARGAKLLESRGVNVSSLPLSAYRDQSFYVMRTDALDRFGTRLEHRFTRSQIAAMMSAAGLGDIRFREDVPYWCAIGTRER